jgi:hypothetical protein
MNKAEINSNLEKLDNNQAKLDKQAESMIALREKLVLFMKANNLKRLVIDDLVIDLEEDEVE